MKKMEQPTFATSIDNIEHTNCYCEENIYCLLRDRLPAAQVDSSTVVFISGRSSDYVPLFCQRAAANRNAAVHWDYHVILISRLPKGAWPPAIVFDFDTALRKDQGVSVPFHTYAAMTLYNALSNNSAMHELNADYLKYFASDRAHMIEKSQDGVDIWRAPPPPYDAIANEVGETNTLNIYRDFKSKNCSKDPRFGRIVDEKGFLKEFGSPELERTLLTLSAKSIRYNYLREFLPLTLSTTNGIQGRSGDQNQKKPQEDSPTSEYPHGTEAEAEETATLQASESFHIGGVLPLLGWSVEGGFSVVQVAMKPEFCENPYWDLACVGCFPVPHGLLKRTCSREPTGGIDIPRGKMVRLTLPDINCFDRSLQSCPRRTVELGDMATAIYGDVTMPDLQDLIFQDDISQSPPGDGTERIPIDDTLYDNRSFTYSESMDLDAPSNGTLSMLIITNLDRSPPSPRTVMSLDYILDKPLLARRYPLTEFLKVGPEGVLPDDEIAWMKVGLATSEESELENIQICPHRSFGYCSMCIEAFRLR